jgi:hypothetical protein
MAYAEGLISQKEINILIALAAGTPHTISERGKRDGNNAGGSEGSLYLCVHVTWVESIS